MNYNKPEVIKSQDLAEGIYAASGNTNEVTVSAAIDHSDDQANYWNVQVPPNFQNTGRRVQISMSLTEKSTYFDCRVGNWVDGHYNNNEDANVAIAYHNDPGPTAQFVIVPKTASVISVKFKFV